VALSLVVVLLFLNFYCCFLDVNIKLYMANTFLCSGQISRLHPIQALSSGYLDQKISIEFFKNFLNELSPRSFFPPFFLQSKRDLHFVSSCIGKTEIICHTSYY
jgi:hypothetical protein